MKNQTQALQIPQTHARIVECNDQGLHMAINAMFEAINAPKPAPEPIVEVSASPDVRKRRPIFNRPGEYRERLRTPISRN